MWITICVPGVPAWQCILHAFNCFSVFLKLYFHIFQIASNRPQITCETSSTLHHCKSYKQCFGVKIDKNMLIVEFGSGQSTHWYAKRCKEIISHETTENWLEKVKKNLRKAGCFNVKLIMWDGETIS